MKLSNTKGVEYANSNSDANANFKKLGAELDLDPKKVLWVYLQKHLYAITSFLRTGKVFSTESIKGRIHDAILYLFILLTMMEEEE